MSTNLFGEASGGWLGGVGLPQGPRAGARSLVSRVASTAAELAWPTRCVLCDAPGELLCERCREDLPWLAQRWACPNCGAPFGWVSCTECDASRGELWETRACVCALPLADAGRALALSYKDAGERRLAPVIAAVMACALDEASAWPAADGAARFDASELDAVCFVPATRAAFARRGFDHMEDVSRSLAGMLGLPLADVLARPEAQDQRRLGREERFANAACSTLVVGDVTACSLLLVDDVVTTGASMRACARDLLAHGAGSVTASALARTW